MARNQLHHACGDVALYEVLAVAGDVYDARLIERCMRRDGMSEQALLALGGLGYARSLPILTQALALENEGIATAAARALLRMTGAPMWQIMEVEDEDGDSVEMEVPVTSPAEWQTWLATKGDLFRAGRYRAGAKFSLESCWIELREPNSRGYERRMAALELVVRGGWAIDLEVDGWLADSL